LIDKGHAVRAAGATSISTQTRDPDYGKLCNRDPEQRRGGRASRSDESGATPGTSALWKGARPGGRLGKVPWGPRSPRLAHRMLGHEQNSSAKRSTATAAGLDLQFPTSMRTSWPNPNRTLGQPFSRYWMHNGPVENGHVQRWLGSGGNSLKRRRFAASGTQP